MSGDIYIVGETYSFGAGLADAFLVKYGAPPLYSVHLESLEDTAGTSNLGNVTFDGVVHTLPDNVSKEGEVYSAEYQVAVGYEFDHWETVGGVSVSGSTDNPATFTVSGDGTLKAVYRVPPPPSVHAIVRGMNEGIYYSSYPVGSWGSWIRLSGVTGESPAGAVLDDDLHLVVRGMGRGLYHGWVDLSTESFTGWTRISGGTPSTPTLTSSGTALHLVVRGDEYRIYYRAWSGGVWGDWGVLPEGGRTIDSPGAAVMDDQLHLVVIGTDERLYHGYMDLSTDLFSGWTEMSGSTPSPPVLASSADSIYLVVRGTNQGIYHRIWHGSWSGWSRLPGATSDGPGAYVLGGELHIAVRGMTGGIYHGWLDISTQDFYGWNSMSGDTPSPPTLTGD